MSLESLLQNAQRPLLVAHIAPDGDCIGSLLGLGWALKEHGKQPTLACADPLPESTSFLPGSAEVVSRCSGAEDLIISLDSSDVQRLGSLYDADLFRRLPVVNIDHHVTNTRFGAEQLIDPSATSTAQIVLALLRRLGWPVSPWAATCLLTGLVTDTRSFRTPNTDSKAMRAALDLMEAGAPLAEINQHLEHGLALGTIRLWGQVLSAVQFKDGIIWAEVTQEMQRACSTRCADTSGLVSFIANAREAQIAFLLTEKADGRIEVGIRSVPGVDVSAAALALGGGGHRQAAGCTLPGPIVAARQAVLAQLAHVLKPMQSPLLAPLGDEHVTRSASMPRE